MWDTLGYSLDHDVQKLEDIKTRELINDAKEILGYTAISLFILFTLWCFCKKLSYGERRSRRSGYASAGGTPQSTQASLDEI